MAAPPVAAIALPILAMAFVVYRRVRAHIGRQKLQPIRMTVRMALLAMLGAGFLVAMPMRSASFAVLGGVLGVGLALWSLHLVHMEQSPEGTFYTANIYIGLGVTALLVGRVLYRVIVMSDAMQAAAARSVPDAPRLANPWQSMFDSPLTLTTLFVMIFYYVTFYGGLLRRAKTLAETIATPAAASSESPHP